MTDETPVPVPPESEAAGEVPLIEEVDEEAIAAARAAAIAENDRAVEAELRGATRRGFLTMGVAAAVGVGAWTFLRSRPPAAGLPKPFRSALETNDKVAMAYFRPTRLNPEYPASRITRPARINGGLGLSANNDPAAWRLTIEVKYGVKNIKRVGTIRYTDVKPADFWAEQGYDWYLGL